MVESEHELVIKFVDEQKLLVNDYYHKNKKSNLELIEMNFMDLSDMMEHHFEEEEKYYPFVENKFLKDDIKKIAKEFDAFDAQKKIKNYEDKYVAFVEKASKNIC